MAVRVEVRAWNYISSFRRGRRQIPSPFSRPPTLPSFARPSTHSNGGAFLATFADAPEARTKGCPTFSRSWSRQVNHARPPEEPTYATVEQVAAMLQVSVRSVYRLVETNADMPVLKLRGAMRFPRQRLALWLRDREQGRAQPKIRPLSIVKAER